MSRNRDYAVRRSDRPHLTGTRTQESLTDAARRASADIRQVKYLGPAGGGGEHLVREPGNSQPFRVKGPPGFRAVPRALIAVGQHAGAGPPFIIVPGTQPDPGQPRRAERQVNFPALDPIILAFVPESITASIASGGPTINAVCRGALLSHAVYSYQRVGGSWLFRGAGEETRAFSIDSFNSSTSIDLFLSSESAAPGDIWVFKATLVTEGGDNEPPIFESQLSLGLFTVTWIA